MAPPGMAGPPPGSPGMRPMPAPGLLGMAPGSELPHAGAGPVIGQPPPPPNTGHLTEQIAPLQALIDTQKEQIKQSEANLSGQWDVLQQTQDSKIEEAVAAALEEALQDLCAGTKISMEEMLKFVYR